MLDQGKKNWMSGGCAEFKVAITSEYDRPERSRTLAEDRVSET